MICADRELRVRALDRRKNHGIPISIGRPNFIRNFWIFDDQNPKIFVSASFIPGPNFTNKLNDKNYHKKKRQTYVSIFARLRAYACDKLCYFNPTLALTFYF